MLKQLICLIIALCSFISTNVFATSFLDVETSNERYDAIMELCDKNIFTGYEDNTFRPKNYITRAEAATIIVRVAEYQVVSEEQDLYSDVSKSHWAYNQIITATNNGIINGMGNGIFSPESQVTYNQIIKMIVCMIGFEDDAIKNGGWAQGYIDVAYQKDIIDSEIYWDINYDRIGDNPATREDVAYILYNALACQERNTLHIGNGRYTIGMSADGLDMPDEKLHSTANFIWYVYGTNTYKNFYAVGVDENKVVALASAGDGFNYLGYRCGDIKTTDDENFCLYTDSNNNNKIHGVLIIDDNYTMNYYDVQHHIGEQLAGESKMNFHFTNAFRVFHNCDTLKWSDKAAKSAQLHSEDMARNNYFSHDNLNGISASERMTKQGIQWSNCAENIAAGGTRYLGFHSYDGWVNSAGHRSNMLSNNDYLGVGIAYNSNSEYLYYHTQNFFSK